MRIYAPRPNPCDWIRAIPVLQKAHLCVRVFPSPRPNRHEILRV